MKVHVAVQYEISFKILIAVCIFCMVVYICLLIFSFVFNFPFRVILHKYFPFSISIPLLQLMHAHIMEVSLMHEQTELKSTM